jgi:anti-sigma-K factor RskA
MSTPLPPLPPLDDDALLAGEYVLGVLDQQARRDAAERAGRDPAFAAEVARWDAAFSPWLLRVDAVEPATHVWPRIRTALGWPAVEGARKGLWDNAAFWRGTTALAVAASVFAVAIGVWRAPEPIAPAPPPVVVVQPPPAAEEAAALPVTVLATDDGNTGWIARVAPDRSKVLMVPTPRPVDAGGKVNELWIIASGEAPRSLGFVSNDKAHSIDIPATLRDAVAAGAVFAVTLEPEQGLPHAAPTGPIVAKGQILAI